MSEEKRYYLRIEKKLVEVSQDVYKLHYKTKRRTLYLEERDEANGVVSYHSQDMMNILSEDITGEETLHDPYAPTPEDSAIKHIMHENLHEALNRLTDDEMNLIQALFFDGLSEREWSQKCGIAQKTINDRKRRILIKLKKLMEI
ncbi:MAG: sigma-70 family RNA polymerase sigma factor [Clostridia bacterium]